MVTLIFGFYQWFYLCKNNKECPELAFLDFGFVFGLLVEIDFLKAVAFCYRNSQIVIFMKFINIALRFFFIKL